MVDGGQFDPDLYLLEMVAVVADYYDMPLFEYIDGLGKTADKYGLSAAMLELQYALELRELKATRQIEAQERANR